MEVPRMEPFRFALSIGDAAFKENLELLFVEHARRFLLEEPAYRILRLIDYRVTRSPFLVFNNVRFMVRLVIV